MHNRDPHLATVPHRLKQWILTGRSGSGSFPCSVSKEQQMPAPLPALGHRAGPRMGCCQVDGKQKSPSGSSPLYPLAEDQDLQWWQRGRWGCWLRQAAPFPNLYSCVLQHALSIDNHVLFLTAALTPLCFFGVQICQGCWLRKYIKAFFSFHLLESESFYISEEK